MSVLKYKDASGNWVETDMLVSGQLKIEAVSRMSDKVSFDLTKYTNGRFLLYYTGNYVSRLFDSAQPDGYGYRINADGGTSAVDKGYKVLFGNSGEAPIAESTSEHNAYTYENGIFTWKQNLSGVCQVGESAVVIYAE